LEEHIAPAFLLVLAEIISSTLKMEAICSSETSVSTEQTARRHISEDDTLHNHRCENLKTYKEIPCLYRNPEVYYRANDILPLFPILSQMDPANNVTSPFFTIRCDIILPKFGIKDCYIKLNRIYPSLISS
jgi:hypothetical protein